MTSSEVLRILYPGSVEGRSRRFTQDTPILPDVWIAYGDDPLTAHELLMTPHRSCSSAELAKELAERLRADMPKPASSRKRKLETAPVVTFNDSHVLAKLTFRQLIRAALPLSVWWSRDLAKQDVSVAALKALERRTDLKDMLLEPARQDSEGVFPENVLNLIRIAGAISLNRPMPEGDRAIKKYLVEVVQQVEELIRGLKQTEHTSAPLWNIFTNRTATAALSESRLTVKADAAVQLFNIKCQGIRFAVIDSGIDATHAAFTGDRETFTGAKTNKDRLKLTRVIKTLDFTRLKELVAVDISTEGEPPNGAASAGLKGLTKKAQQEIRRDMRQRLQDGRPLEWKLLADALEMLPPDYRPPKNEHGTHVAGIIAGNWPDHVSSSGEPEPLIGLGPDIELYDLRVIGPDGTGDEFCILAALQYVRYLNQSRGRMVIHGVNLSISIPHLASSFACGQTPICDEVNRLVNSGVVVVAAAGNGGYGGAGVAAANDYRDISITDPGNADGVITVGATHGGQPHRFGVSYFSSRGPTGDGRAKPDLVAPGEQIRSTIPGGKSVVLDGTSMAAPHVSGAAALLMARHRELIGDPARIKSVLCKTATDLGRCRDFQGAGLLDVLRALQSI